MGDAQALGFDPAKLAALTEQEVRSLRGIVSSLTRAHEKRKEQRDKERAEQGRDEG